MTGRVKKGGDFATLAGHRVDVVFEKEVSAAEMLLVIGSLPVNSHVPLKKRTPP